MLFVEGSSTERKVIYQQRNGILDATDLSNAANKAKRAALVYP